MIGSLTVSLRSRCRFVSRVAALGAAFLLLAGCEGLLSGIGGPPPDLYTLTPKSSFETDLPQIEAQLVVEEPFAAGGLNTDRIVLSDRPTQLKYFAGSKWTERAPRMIQTLMVESFENTGRIVAVGRQAIGLRSDYNLKSELREFQAEYYHGDTRPTVRVRLNVKLVKQPRRVIIASETFEAALQAEGTKMPEIVAAYDEALGRVLRRAVGWTLRTM